MKQDFCHVYLRKHLTISKMLPARRETSSALNVRIHLHRATVFSIYNHSDSRNKYQGFLEVFNCSFPPYLSEILSKLHSPFLTRELSILLNIKSFVKSACKITGISMVFFYIISLHSFHYQPFYPILIYCPSFHSF